MAADTNIERILRLFPEDCRPLEAVPFTPAESFSGAGLWRIRAPRGWLCLRRWPAGHPDSKRLEFIQAVLWHVNQEGFCRLALPLETQHRHGFVWHAGHLWELAPWLPGTADYRARPNLVRLRNALTALGRFHRAAATFPLPEGGSLPSPGVAERLLRLRSWLDGGTECLQAASRDGSWKELNLRADPLLRLFASVAPSVLSVLENASRQRVALQPCIRDIWHAHVLFVDDEVSGLVDFGGMRPENVAADVARLLGSLALDDVEHWQAGLEAYQSVRRLSEDELALVRAFDRSTVLMGGMQWLEWVYLEGKQFANLEAVLARVDEFLGRLANLERAAA